MIITEEKRIKDLADNIVSRTNEVYLYDVNISNYQTILSSSDGEFPEHLLALKDLSYNEAIAQCPLADLAELSELYQYTQVSHVIRTEIIERTKANSILQALTTQLRALVSEEEYNTAIAEAVARRG
jgi:hypothetical protein